MTTDIQELLQSIDIEWVLDREGVTYRESHGRSGRQLNVRTCPSCGSSGYKVYINAETGLGNCFSGDCEAKTFNKWKFLGNLFDSKGGALVTLLQDLAREQGWRPKRASIAVKQDFSKLELPASIAIADMESPPEYLVRRGVTKDIASYFGLRWCERGTFPITLANGRPGVQDYSNRIIIPVLDLNQQLVTFQGRDVTGTAEKRYLFPPAFAATGSHLYNGFNWQPGMDTIVVSEGVFDVIGVKQAVDADQDLRDMLPVGTFGMHLSQNSPTGDDQMGALRALKRSGLRRVIFLWDGEYKAVRAAGEASVALRGVGLEPWIAMLPTGKDPGDAGQATIQRALRTAHPSSSKMDLLKVLTLARKQLGNT